MTDELKLTVSAIEHADDKRKKAPKADYRFYKDPLWPDNSVNVEVDGKRKVLFLVSGHGEPILVYFGEKGKRPSHFKSQDGQVSLPEWKGLQ